MLVICPSRGRPQNIERLVQGFRDTESEAGLLVCTDDDDVPYPLIDGVRYRTAPRRRMAPTLNDAALEEALDYGIIGFMGDDHLPRTPHWDWAVRDAMEAQGGGIVYGNDLIQGQALPTAVFMSTDVIRVLGWMCLPGALHLYLDDTWLHLGRQLGRLKYLPDVVIEHLHPVGHTAEWDAGYREVNDDFMYAHDGSVFREWEANKADVDVARVKVALGW